MQRHVSRRALLTAAVGATALAAGLRTEPAWAASRPAAASGLLAVAGLGYAQPGRGILYGYRILAPAGNYRSAADGTITVAEALRQVQGSRIVLVNGIAAELSRALTASAGGTWDVGQSTAAGTRAASGLEVIAFLPRQSLGNPATIAGQPVAVQHIYTTPYR